jgi:glycosyltransferase involved in cell wall biosynthesis
MELKISVIIPAYNMEGLIEKTLSSLLVQTMPPDEVIVVNDGSTDNTLAVIKHWQSNNALPFTFHIIDKINGGLSSARNIGIRAAKSQLIALLDSDDRYEPAFLETSLQAFTARPNLALFFANQKVVNERDEKLFDWLENKEIMKCSYSVLVNSINILNENIVTKLIHGNFISCSASVFNAKYIDVDNLYDENVKGGEDVEFLMRFLPDKDVAFTFEELAIVLRHSGSITQSKRHLVHLGRIFALNKNKVYLQGQGFDVEYLVKEQFTYCYYQVSLNGLHALREFSRMTKKTVAIHFSPSTKDYLRAIKHSLNF